MSGVQLAYGWGYQFFESERNGLCMAVLACTSLVPDPSSLVVKKKNAKIKARKKEEEEGSGQMAYPST